MAEHKAPIGRVAVQHTVCGPVTFNGKGVHSNLPVSMTICPADANTGIVFVRTAPDGSEVEIPAIHSSVGATELCTIIGDPRGIFVATIEHLMAALRALGIDNARIEIDGAEVPVLDGSSHDFVAGLLKTGLMAQAARRRFIRVERPVRVDMGASFGEFTPHDGCFFDVEIDFDDPTIGRQRYSLELTPDSFAKEIARARTFGFMRDVEKLWEAGYALGSSFDNSVVISDDGVVNPEGLRFGDEFVRHKLLDAVGDLALSGLPILGAYRSYRGGHKLNAMVLKALVSDKTAWSYVEANGALGASGASVGRADHLGNQAVALAPSVS